MRRYLLIASFAVAVFGARAPLAQADGDDALTPTACNDCSCLRGTLMIDPAAPMINQSAPVTGQSVALNKPEDPFGIKAMSTLSFSVYKASGFKGDKPALMKKLADFATSTSPKIYTRAMSEGDFLRYNLTTNEVMFISQGQIIFAGKFQSEEEMRAINGRGYPFPLAEILGQRLYLAMGLRFDGAKFRFPSEKLQSGHYQKHTDALYRHAGRFISLTGRYPTPQDYELSAQQHLSSHQAGILTLITDPSIHKKVSFRILRLSLTDLGTDRSTALITVAGGVDLSIVSHFNVDKNLFVRDPRFFFSNYIAGASIGARKESEE